MTPQVLMAIAMLCLQSSVREWDKPICQAKFVKCIEAKKKDLLTERIASEYLAQCVLDSQGK